jgi:hypothetical protein
MQYQTEVVACRIRKELKAELESISAQMQLHQSELLRSMILGFIENHRGFEEVDDEMPVFNKSPDPTSWENSY